MERSSEEALVFEVLILWRSARNVTPPYEWVVAGRLVMDRVAQGDDLGRFSSKYSVYISQRERERERNYKPPSFNPYFQQKNILVYSNQIY